MCDALGVDGIRFDGTQFNDLLNNDSGFSSHMIGAAGNDQLDGGTINDVMVSDAGNETLAGQAGIDTVVYGTPAGGPVVVTIDDLGNDGTAAENDNVLSSTENVVGTPNDDILVGSDFNNTLNGLGGRDHLEGRGGNDIFNESPAPSGADDMRGGPGTDLVTYAGRAVGVTVSLDNLANDGSAADAFPFAVAPGDNVRSDVENVLATDRNDVINGSAVANVLTASGGNDTVDGREGDDALVGRRGDRRPPRRRGQRPAGGRHRGRPARRRPRRRPHRRPGGLRLRRLPRADGVRCSSRSTPPTATTATSRTGLPDGATH